VISDPLTQPAQRSALRRAPSTVTIIIPAFNEQSSIGVVLDSLREWRDRAQVIVIDDGSTDRTAEIAQQYAMRVIRHPINKGYGAALKTGIRAASGDVIVMMDADGQHCAEQIDALLDVMGDNDMVVGARGQGSHSPFVRRPLKWLLGQVANYLTQTKIPDLNSGLRAFRADVAKSFLHLLPNRFSFSTILTLALLKEGYNIAYVPIVVTPRVGKSVVNPISDGFNAILLIVRIIALFDPLRVFLPTSIVLFVLGAAYWILSVVLRLEQQNPQAALLHIPTGAMILIVSSVVIFMFGILADQISAVRRSMRE
jgi:glycosyltransferase involved in cell wall biosynthesis